MPGVAAFPELGFAQGCLRTLLVGREQGGSPEGQSSVKGAGGEGFIHCFSCWDAAGWEVEAEEVFKLWISGVGLCLVIQWRLDCTALRMVWSCFGGTHGWCSLRRGDATLWHL